MKYDILYEGAFAMLKVHIEQGEAIKAESGAMVSMSPNVEIKGTMDGGLMGGLGRMLSGEKFFFQELRSTRGPFSSSSSSSSFLIPSRVKIISSCSLAICAQLPHLTVYAILAHFRYFNCKIK